MTFDPMQHGGRTQEQVERNEQCCEWIAYCLIVWLALGTVGYWVGLV